MNIRLSFFLCFFTSFSTIFSQNQPEVPVVIDNSVNGQFDSLYKKSNNYQDYKVVKRTSFIELKEKTIDSLNALKSIISKNQNLIETQKTEIKTLNNNLSSTKSSLNVVTEEKDAITFFGAPLTKDGYKTMMWGIVAALFGLLLFFIFRYQSSLKGTKEAIANLDDVEKEFEDHRRRALEREQIINRKLQDEINKHKQQ